jgi:hypothetical protein
MDEPLPNARNGRLAGGGLGLIGAGVLELLFGVYTFCSALLGNEPLLGIGFGGSFGAISVFISYGVAGVTSIALGVGIVIVTEMRAEAARSKRILAALLELQLRQLPTSQ